MYIAFSIFMSRLVLPSRGLLPRCFNLVSTNSRALSTPMSAKFGSLLSLHHQPKRFSSLFMDPMQVSPPSPSASSSTTSSSSSSSAPAPAPSSTTVSSMMAGLGLSGGAFPGAPAKEHSGIIFFDNVFPHRIHRLDFRFKMISFDAESVLNRLNSKVFIRKAEVCDKEGGLLVHFRSDEADTEEILGLILESLQKRRAKGWMTGSIGAHLVRGKPFVDDLLSVYPSIRLAISYRSKEAIPEETLFKEFRKYGEIYSIAVDAKVVDGVRTSIVNFKNVRGAVAARHCMHGAKIGPEKSQIACKYEPILKSSTISDWFNKHSRLMVPVVLGLLALLTYLVIDPLRVFFITNHITNRFTLKLRERAMQLTQWMYKTKSIDMKSTGRSVNTPDLEELKMLLRGDPGTVIFLTGATGSGKSELVRRAIQDYKHVLTINMRRLDVISDEHDFVHELTRQVGCFPGFTFSTIIGHMSDLAGISPKGFASTMTLEGKVSQIFQCVGYALQGIYKKHGSKNQADIAVIVIEGMEIEHIDKHERFYNQLIQWAGQFSARKVAHIVFTSDPQVHDELVQKKMLELDKKVQNVALSDAANEDAFEFVRTALPADNISDQDIHSAVRVVGGRFTDLQMLVRKVLYGLSINGAANDMVQRSAFTLRKRGLGERQKEEGKEGELPWSKAQFWLVLEKIAKNEEVSYDEIVFNPLFNGDASKLHAMVRADLVRVIDEVGRPKLVKASRPLYRAAFQHMLNAPGLGDGMTVIKNNDLIKIEQAKIDKYVEELQGLEKIHGTSSWFKFLFTFGLCKLWKNNTVRDRQQFLLERLRLGHETVKALTRDNVTRSARLKNLNVSVSTNK